MNMARGGEAFYRQSILTWLSLSNARETQLKVIKMNGFLDDTLDWRVECVRGFHKDPWHKSLLAIRGKPSQIKLAINHGFSQKREGVNGLS